MGSRWGAAFGRIGWQASFGLGGSFAPDWVAGITGIRTTDGWGAYERHIEPEQHAVGTQHTQKIESKHINLRTRIKRLVRRTICFSKTERMHDLVIGLFVNRYEFGRLI
jgi:hypothetical protein